MFKVGWHGGVLTDAKGSRLDHQPSAFPPALKRIGSQRAALAPPENGFLELIGCQAQSIRCPQEHVSMTNLRGWPGSQIKAELMSNHNQVCELSATWLRRLPCLQSCSKKKEKKRKTHTDYKKQSTKTQNTTVTKQKFSPIFSKKLDITDNLRSHCSCETNHLSPFEGFL